MRIANCHVLIVIAPDALCLSLDCDKQSEGAGWLLGNSLCGFYRH